MMNTMKNYPFKILIVKMRDSYRGRVIYQEGSPEFPMMIDEGSEAELVYVRCASMFEYAVEDSGGTLFLRGSDKFDDHRHFCIGSHYYHDIIPTISKLNDAIAITYENHAP